MFLSFRLSSEGDLTEDTSVQLRLMTQTVYWALVMEKPFLGHGFGSDIHYLETGPIFLSAHSDALRCAMEYGFIYSIIFALLMIQTYLIRCRHEIEKVLQTNAVGQFAFVTVLLFIVASIMDSRTFYVILGIFLAQLYCPRHIFRFEEKTGRIDAILSRREIYRRFLKKKYLYRPGKSYVDA
jgi:O-antigen ligase